jgi:hypothetical protein
MQTVGKYIVNPTRNEITTDDTVEVCQSVPTKVEHFPARFPKQYPTDTDYGLRIIGFDPEHYSTICKYYNDIGKRFVDIYVDQYGNQHWFHPNKFCIGLHPEADFEPEKIPYKLMSEPYITMFDGRKILATIIECEIPANMGLWEAIQQARNLNIFRDVFPCSLLRGSLFPEEY